MSTAPKKKYVSKRAQKINEANAKLARENEAKREAARLERLGEDVVQKEKQDHYAVLSDIAYQKHKRTKEQFLKDNNLNYDIDHDLSTKQHTVLIDRNTKKPVIAYRGTKDLHEDLPTDLALALGAENLTSRFRNSNKLIDQVIEKHGVEPVLTGHSLASAIALTHGRARDLEVHAFNPGAAVSQVRGALDKSYDGKKQKNERHVYTTGTDPISFLSQFAVGEEKIHHVKAKGLNTHGLGNFTSEVEEKRV